MNQERRERHCLTIVTSMRALMAGVVIFIVVGLTVSQLSAAMGAM